MDAKRAQGGGGGGGEVIKRFIVKMDEDVVGVDGSVTLVTATPGGAPVVPGAFDGVKRAGAAAVAVTLDPVNLDAPARPCRQTQNTPKTKLKVRYKFELYAEARANGVWWRVADGTGVAGPLKGSAFHVQWKKEKE